MLGGGGRFAGFVALAVLAGAVGGPLRGLLAVRVETELGGSPAFSSFLQSLILVGAGVFALAGGVLSDRLGPKRALSLGLLQVPLMALLYLSTDVGFLLVLALAAGLLTGVHSVGGQAYLIGAAPAGSLGVASALYFVGATLGTSLGSVAAGFVVERGGFGALGVVAMVASVILVGGAAWWLPPAGTPNAAIPRAARDLDRRDRTGDSTPPAADATAEAPGRAALRSDMLLVATVRFLPTCFWGAATLLTPLILFRLSGSVVAVSLYASVSLALAAGCQILTGRVSDRVGRGGPVLALSILLPLCALAMGLASRSYEAFFAAGVVATMVAWSITVNFPPLVRELAPPAEQGCALGFLHLLWTTGMLVGTLAGGALIEADAALPFLLAAALNLPTAVAGMLLWWRLRGRQRAAISSQPRQVS